MSNPVCSIIVPCYNQGKYLNESLNSVLVQTLPDWECIIINDGSSDETEEIVHFWLEKDERFRYLPQENMGLPAARNFGIQSSKGEFILPLDADDKIGADYIRLAIAEFKKDESLKLIYCKAEKFGLENGVWPLKPFNLKNLGLENMIFASAVFRRKDFLSINGYDRNMKYGWEDWELWISMLKSGGGVKQLNSVQFFYRTKVESMLNSITKAEEKYLYNYISIKHADFYVEQYGAIPSLVIQIRQKELELNRTRTSLKSGLSIVFRNVLRKLS